DVEVLETRQLGAGLLERAAAAGADAVAVEAEHLSVAAYERLRATAGVHLVVTSGLVESLRVVKDDSELAALRTAATITDEAFTAVLPRLRPEVTERQIAWALLAAMT